MYFRRWLSQDVFTNTLIKDNKGTLLVHKVSDFQGSFTVEKGAESTGSPLRGGREGVPVYMPLSV